MKIGFFGDSFCEAYDYWAQIAVPWKKNTIAGTPKSKDMGPLLMDMREYNTGEETYIKKICDHYNAECVHLGSPGTSVWDCILNQFIDYTQEHGLPDVAVMVWTDWSRLYHPTVRGINIGAVHNGGQKHWSKRLHLAAKYYFDEIYDDRKARFEYAGALKWFDDYIKHIEGSGTGKCKFIHLHAYGMTLDRNEKEEFEILTVYPYHWEHGRLIKPSLVNLIIEGHKFHNYSTEVIQTYSANHIHGDDKNKRLAQGVIKAIDGYDQNTKDDDNAFYYSVRRLMLTDKILKDGGIPLTEM